MKTIKLNGKNKTGKNGNGNGNGKNGNGKNGKNKNNDLSKVLFPETDKLLKELVAQTKKHEEELLEIKKQNEEIKKQNEEKFLEIKKQNEEERKKQNEEFNKKTEISNKRLEKIAEMVGNIGNNNGSVAEEFFYNGLASAMSLGNINFDLVVPNLHGVSKDKIEDEFDIVMSNLSTVVIVEIKYKVHQNDVTKLIEKKIPNYKRIFSNMANCELYGAIAGLSIPDDVKELAKQSGLFVMTQAGNDIKILNDKVRSYQNL